MPTDVHFFHHRWPVFYEDNHLLALFKPAGLLAQGDDTGDPSLLDLAKLWVKMRHRKPGRVFLGLIHRLDRPVAGVMLFARTSKAASRLSAQFRSGSIRKLYLAVVEGVPASPSLTLCHHIERRGRLCRIVPAPTDRSRKARLHYQMVDTIGDRSLLNVVLETGRKHQIRLQLSHVGLPLVGDVRYGAKAPLNFQQIALLARELAITHPTLNSPLKFICSMPVGWPWPSNQPLDSRPLWNWDDFGIGTESLGHLRV